MRTKLEEIRQPCTSCGKNHVVRHGSNMTKNLGKRPRLKCQDCGTTFYEIKSEDK